MRYNGQQLSSTSENDLLKKNAKWIWSKECEDPFQKIKSYLLVDLSLAHFELKKEIIVASDASNYRIGDVKMGQAYSPCVQNSTSCRKKLEPD